MVLLGPGLQALGLDKDDLVQAYLRLRHDRWMDWFTGRLQQRAEQELEKRRRVNELLKQAQQQVLGLDVRRAELAGFVAGEEEHPAGTFGITLKHDRPIIEEPGRPPPVAATHSATWQF